MAGKVLNKMMGFLGLEDDIEDELEETGTEGRTSINGRFSEEDDVEPVMIGNKKGNKVVSIHTAGNPKIKILKPSLYEDAADICDDLKNRKIVVVNITNMESRTAQRVLDFIGGASYALSGSLEEVEKGVYIVSPSNVEVSNELKTELSTKGIFSWSK